MSLQLLALAGDGIGPEITAATLQLLAAAQRKFKLDIVVTTDDVGVASHRKHGHTIPDSLVARARAADGVILGPCDTYAYPPVDQGGVNPSMTLRRQMDLYANIRPSRAVPGVDCLTPDMDLVIVRENTEGFYADRNMFAGGGEFMPTPDVAIAMRKITREGSRRVARAACELARTRGRKLLIVSKANVLKLTDGLFRREAEAVAAEYKDLTVAHELVDAMASLLVRTPGAFDVIVTTNMFGDILSNQASELAGGLGLAGSLNAGDAHAMAQASHGSAPDIAGKGIANPTSLMLSVAMLLDWLGQRHARAELRQAGAAIDAVLREVLKSRGNRTSDLGGPLGTAAFADLACAALEK